MRSTSLAAFETKMSQCSSSWMSAKLSVKKWPEPVRTHAQRGVCSLAMPTPPSLMAHARQFPCPAAFPTTSIAERRRQRRAVRPDENRRRRQHGREGTGSTMPAVGQAGDVVAGAERVGLLDQQQRLGAEPGRQARRQANPMSRPTKRGCRPPAWPSTTAARPVPYHATSAARSPPATVPATSRSSRSSNDAAELLHGEDRHGVGGLVGKAHALLRIAHLVGERPAARHDDERQAGRRQHLDPDRHFGHAGRAAAKLDDCRLMKMSPCWPRRPRAASRRQARRGAAPRLLGRALALDLDADAAGPEFELFHPHGDRMTRGSSSTSAATCSASASLSCDMAARDDGADAVHDDVVGKDMAHVLRA